MKVLESMNIFITQKMQVLFCKKKKKNLMLTADKLHHLQICIIKHNTYAVTYV